MPFKWKIVAADCMLVDRGRDHCVNKPFLQFFRSLFQSCERRFPTFFRGLSRGNFQTILPAVYYVDAFYCELSLGSHLTVIEVIDVKEFLIKRDDFGRTI